ncbi:MAG: glycosyltransferase family 10 domain-containing protein [Candidatus Kapaibacteriales bacterium]
MDRVKVWFTDFWKGFNVEDNYFVNLLRKDFDVEITDTRPDFLFFSVFGNKYTRYFCIRIFYTGENIRPNFKETDWAFSFDYINNDRHYRLPFYGLHPDLEKLLLPRNPNKIVENKEKFCAFIFSNPSAKKRNLFFKKLSNYKRVDSGGAVFNNLRFRVKDKIDFLKKYKFSIAFENEEFPGYTTEKILESFIASSVPIYWGNPLVDNDFNTKSFLNFYEFGNDEALIEKIIELDQNEDEYIKYLFEPPFPGNQLNTFVNPENVRIRLKKIITTDVQPIAWVYHKNAFLRRKYYFFSDMKKVWNYLQKKQKNFSLFWLKVRLKEKFKKLFSKKFQCLL